MDDGISSKNPWLHHIASTFLYKYFKGCPKRWTTLEISKTLISVFLWTGSIAPAIGVVRDALVRFCSGTLAGSYRERDGDAVPASTRRTSHTWFLGEAGRIISRVRDAAVCCWVKGKSSWAGRTRLSQADAAPGLGVEISAYTATTCRQAAWKETEFACTSRCYGACAVKDAACRVGRVGGVIGRAGYGQGRSGAFHTDGHLTGGGIGACAVDAAVADDVTIQAATIH